MMVSPFARYQLIRNPFGELTVRERAELAVLDVEEYVQWLEHSPRAALQFIGPCGHGKSTHLRALQFAWAARHSTGGLPPFVYFPEEGDQPALPRPRPLFVDEAQRMGWWRRKQLFAGPGPLVIGTHRDLCRELIAAGFQLRTIDLDQPIEIERLQELLNRRIEASQTNSLSSHGSQRCRLSITAEQVVALQERFGSNIRAIEDYLYIKFQSTVLKGEPWLPVE